MVVRPSSPTRRGAKLRPSAAQIARPEFSLRSESDRAHCAEAGDLADAAVVEVGPGPGGLTRALLMADARRVIAIEQDERFCRRSQISPPRSGGRLIVRCEDALRTDLAALADGGPLQVVANLPYNVGTPLPGKMAEVGSLAAALAVADVDVSARSRGAHRRNACGTRRLRALGGAGPVGARRPEFSSTCRPPPSRLRPR